MSKDRYMDRFFRRKLKHHASEVPVDMWSRIEAKREFVKAEKRRRRLGGYLFLFALLMTGAGLFSYFWNVTSMSVPFAVNAETIPPKENLISKNTSPDNQSRLVAQAKRVGKSTIKETLDIQTPVQKSPPPVNPLANNVSINNNKAVDKTRVKKTAVPVAEKEKETPSSPFISVDTAPNSVIESLPVPEDFTQTSGLEETENELPKIKTKEIDKLGLNFSFVNTPQEEEEKGLFGLLPDAECAKFANRKFRRFVEFFVAPEYVFQALEAKTESSEEYAALRRNSESFRSAYSTGVRFALVSKEGLAVRTGLVYSEINQDFKYVETSEIIYRTNIRVDTIFTLTDTTYVWDTLSIEVILPPAQTIRNQFRIVEIPLFWGYELKKGRYTFSINTGVFFNILFDYKGSVYSPETEPADFSSGNPEFPVFEDRLGLSIYASLGVQYRITPRMQLLFEPYIKNRIKSITLQNYSLDQRFTHIGLNTGLKYEF